MWYHDHAIGLTAAQCLCRARLWVQILRDTAELELVATGALPPGDREIPVIVQDKVFDAAGKLWYPDTYDEDSSNWKKVAIYFRRRPSSPNSGATPCWSTERCIHMRKSSHCAIGSAC